MYDYHNVEGRGRVRLADIDLSEPYEVDYWAIELDQNTGQCYLLNATGCSCWDGDFGEDEFASFAHLKENLLGGLCNGPSLTATIELLDEAERHLVQTIQ